MDSLDFYLKYRNKEEFQLLNFICYQAVDNGVISKDISKELYITVARLAIDVYLHNADDIDLTKILDYIVKLYDKTDISLENLEQVNRCDIILALLFNESVNEFYNEIIAAESSSI